MDPQNCYICNETSVFYSRNLFKTKSKYSETRICEFIRKLLDNYPSEREYTSISIGENEHCVCIECLNKIDEYDLACMTVKRVEKELRDTLLHTETQFFKETKLFSSDELLPPFETIETLDDYNVENFDVNREEESPEQKSGSESNTIKSDSDADYRPSGTSKRRPERAMKPKPKSRLKTEANYHKCLKCNMKFKRYRRLYSYSLEKKLKIEIFIFKSENFESDSRSRVSKMVKPVVPFQLNKKPFHKVNFIYYFVVWLRWPDTHIRHPRAIVSKNKYQPIILARTVWEYFVLKPNM